MWGSVLGCGGRCRKVSGEVWGVWENVLGCGGVMSGSVGEV